MTEINHGAESAARNGAGLGLHPASRSRPFLRCSLRLAALVAACAAGEPGSVMAQIGFPADPFCGMAYVKGGMRQSPDGVKPAGSPEYDVKAALLYRCLELVQWPSGATPAGEPTITVGLLGKNPFGKSLNNLVGKTISGRRLVVRNLRRATEAESCQLLFVASSETKRTSKILKNVASFPVLTVGESPGFGEQGGMINLLLVGKNIRLEINLAAVEQARIVMDPKLITMSSTGSGAGPGSE
jgi:hypothetical protein